MRVLVETKYILVIVVVVYCNMLLQSARKHNKRNQKDMFIKRNLSEGWRPVPRHVFIFSTTGSREINDTKRNNLYWIFHIYNKYEAQDFVNKHCPFAAKAYNAVVPIAYKADIFRYCAMYIGGGVYIDDDLTPIRPLDEIALVDNKGILLVEDLPNYNYWGMITGGRPVYNGFFATNMKHHPFFLCCLETVVQNVENAVQQSKSERRFKLRDSLALTGPHAITPCGVPYSFTLRMLLMSDDGQDPFFIGKSKHDLHFIHKAFKTNPGREKHYGKFDSTDYIK